MGAEAYELLAILMRYVFIGLGALILLRGYLQMRRDDRAYKKEMKKLPDAGLIGEVVDLETGKHHPLPREGMMGSASGCDIRLRRRGVKRQHALFEFAEGKGLRIRPQRYRKVAVEGVPIRSFAYALHGTVVTLGEANIRVRLFAGLNVPHPAAFARDGQEVNETEEPMGDDAGMDMPSGFDRLPVQDDGPEEDLGYMPYGAVPGDFSSGQGQGRFQPPQAGYTGPGYYEAEQLVYREQGYGMPYGQAIPVGQPAEEGEDDEAMPYYSPLPVRHRRSDRR